MSKVAKISNFQELSHYINKMNDRKIVISSPLPSTGYVRLPQVLAVYPVSRSKLYSDIKIGKFPAPTKLSERISAWKVETLLSFLSQQGEQK